VGADGPHFSMKGQCGVVHTYADRNAGA